MAASTRPVSSAPSDAPPAYTPVNTAATTYQAPTLSSTTADDPYAFLSTFDTAILIDDSSSMFGTRWTETAAAISAIAPICTAHDDDGIDLYFLNAAPQAYHTNITTASTVREIFSTVQPRGATPTGQRLHQILGTYLRKCARGVDAVKPLNLIVITDGEPSDDVESVLIRAAKKLDAMEAPSWQVGIQFFQVGNDPAAKKHLQSLDDDLSLIAGAEVRDMVDTVPFLGGLGAELTGEGILKVVLGAVNRRLDRRGQSGLHA